MERIGLTVEITEKSARDRLRTMAIESNKRLVKQTKKYLKNLREIYGEIDS